MSPPPTETHLFFLSHPSQATRQGLALGSSSPRSYRGSSAAGEPVPLHPYHSALFFISTLVSPPAAQKKKSASHGLSEEVTERDFQHFLESLPAGDAAEGLEACMKSTPHLPSPLAVAEEH